MNQVAFHNPSSKYGEKKNKSLATPKAQINSISKGKIHGLYGSCKSLQRNTKTIIRAKNAKNIICHLTFTIPSKYMLTMMILITKIQLESIIFQSLPFGSL